MVRPPFRSWSSIAVVALAWVLGCEALRAFLPMLVFGVRDRFRLSALGGLGSLATGALALALFAVAFLAGPLRRSLGARRTLVVSLWVLAAARLGFQLWAGDTLGHLALVALVVMAFLVMLPSVWTCFGGVTLVLGILTGNALDSALTGALGTYSLNWRSDLPSLLLVIALVAALLLCLRHATTEEAGVAPAGAFLPWTFLGPYLFLQLLIFGNLPRLTVLTGWRQETAFLWLLFSQVAALLAAAMMLERSQVKARQALAVGAALLASLTLPWPQGAVAAALLLSGQGLAALLLVFALAGSRSSPAEGDRSASGHGTGMILLALLFFLYYGSYDISLPFPNTVLPPVAAVLAALAALAAFAAGSGLRSREERGSTPRALPLVAATACLLVLPIARLATASPPPVAEGSGLPLRLMTYNLHCGYDPDGFFTLEEQARAIEEQGADVVALQEVSRGWVINGAVDILPWLGRRLGMDYHFGPTADPLWGNAVLTRRPVTAVSRLPFTHGGVQIRRGLLEVLIPLDGGPPLRLIDTHFHQRRDDSDIRVEESATVLDFWRGASRTAILGDLNATPDTPEMELLRARGFQDVLDLAGTEPGYTFRTGGLARQLDYIWITPDLGARDVVISPSEASDHLGIAATIEAASP